MLERQNNKPRNSSLRMQCFVRRIGVYFGLFLGFLFAGFPVFWMITMSIRPNGEVFDLPPHFLPKVFTFDAYIKIFSTLQKLRYFFNSYFVAFAVTALALIIGCLAGYAFSRFEYKGKKIFNSFIIGTQTIPAITLMIPYFSMMVSFHVYDSYFALIATHLAKCLPFSIIMMTGYFNTLPKELDEGVLIDGGSRWLALWRILVPISIPGMVATGLYTFLQSWNEYLYALTLTKRTEMATVPIGISLLMGEYSYEWSEMMAMSILGSLPIMLLFLFFQKYFLAGMTAGSVKM
ncbi:carbohydrate ABC transporter permease [Treponema sp. Marseille-Q4523]|jgi:ABC-type sugar transport system, permease component|uniref:carbohydrate ABC transporter permease n=1 Tax=Treponema sp. Marseille-Q4523 TaxID=2810610 RepID=UPI0019619A12|nr:carbohydrate ABC transporter permease [Treponema sp. Marseille-Q4523]MBM7022952.1 carbohydrate ABC transporter permease [Treponema sp. Marseille-Q4523]